MILMFSLAPRLLMELAFSQTIFVAAKRIRAR
jgi:hypothetical protein